MAVVRTTVSRATYRVTDAARTLCAYQFESQAATKNRCGRSSRFARRAWTVSCKFSAPASAPAFVELLGNSDFEPKIVADGWPVRKGNNICTHEPQLLIRLDIADSQKTVA